MTDLQDLRDYLAALQELGDLRVIDREVAPDMELGATIRLSYERRAQAPLFTRVAGAEKSRCRVLGAPAALSATPGKPYARVALSLGLPADTQPQQILEHLAAATGRDPIPPVVVEAGACQHHQE